MTKIIKIFWRAAYKFSDDGGFANSSNIALSLLLSLFPFLMLVASILRLFGDPALVDEVVNLIIGHWPEKAADTIATQVKIILAQNPGEFFSLSTFVALILASNGIENARDGLNRAYKIRERRPWLLRRLQGLLFVIVIAFSVITAAFLLVGTPVIWNYLVDVWPDINRFYFTVTITQYGVAASILTLALFGFHYFLPAHRQTFSALIWGILLTIIGIVIGSELFAIYLRTIANYTALYAGLAGTMTAIVYLYCVAILILFGAEVNNALEELRQATSLSDQQDDEDHQPI